MGLLDALRTVLGTRAAADASRPADPEDLFGMSTAYVTMAAELGYDPGTEAALCFAEVDSTDFQAALDDVAAILAAGSEETGTLADFHADDYGYTWVVLRDEDDFEDLVTSVHFAADTLVDHGFGSRLLAAVFGFVREGGDEVAGSDDPPATGDRERPGRVYWIYSFRRGSYYPFVPAGPDERDTRTEFKLRSVLEGELDVETDEAYWYPLWPDEAGGHPWD
jgi:hypothetical protein